MLYSFTKPLTQLRRSNGDRADYDEVRVHGHDHMNFNSTAFGIMKVRKLSEEDHELNCDSCRGIYWPSRQVSSSLARYMNRETRLPSLVYAYIPAKPVFGVVHSLSLICDQHCVGRSSVQSAKF